MFEITEKIPNSISSKGLEDRSFLLRKQGHKIVDNRVWRQRLFHKCVDLLESYQLPSGEIPLICSPQKTMKETQYRKTVFLTAFQAALHLGIQDPKLQTITKRSQDFLRNERSSDGLWRFFGKGSYIDPDIDDTFAALSGLRDDPVVVMSLSETLDKLQLIKAKNGLYNTWIRSSCNFCDLTVNANLLLYLTLLDVDKCIIFELIKNLENMIYGSHIKISRYYLANDTFLFSMHFALRKLGILNSQIFPIFWLPNISQPWFIQNSEQLFYGSPILSICFLIFIMGTSCNGMLSKSEGICE